MWIRTQDKETLLNVNCIDVYNLNKNEWIIEACGNDLGTYESKERAIEVLDDIQKLLKSETYFDRSKLVEYVISKNISARKVYQMPEE